ncbi:bifunctional diaminohydroxyphosphoribosylaminopyrimidine deaminase/5-amino-6-(5-phosphoribosylamino)uracil reductase RibD [Pseudomonas capsici]|uniref:bifunctional diaminohydroxyphosphoribosylaminopyrimidine deaminase/5-amino-6-(5-phosphoribosylamino)uracil reductase RibD n=1 Tax=Pseudomonas capsici TaxID=2810614 RepID=UPI000E3E06B5|nr:MULTISPECIES: bifunctional diaminohydroxyphosphoribosylaminopyrimidine deaminase/5-amino-6-(5-phosphoribosylamino)uracil reductase RibD [Pseudomonas]MBX8610199.1 bifunctional diaminohydroxyphosphoribosylaminopyrimidine deaminase/5-amino-6-(5-phosphoribosylamino)uracil reductase RibD [Pseudomonas cichorii]MBX8615228.1 bifunctional diaminohydroxyphosphoribosylaminopyrimidine deaminase/5-amino-6-(5-phosphoribosylamino)uracil reductase RibD [Pseudomonas cichorii]MCV4265924.1 bifunctional diaminoh
MNHFTECDFQHMQHALSLAARGSHSTWPNPRVGCVIAHGAQVVGEGWHRSAGGPHAEVFALRQAGALAKGATAYVTLEPCSHVGRTGACHQALIDSGIATVVVAHEDPFEKVNGRGIAQLREAGIEVKVGLFRTAARELNRGFLSSVERQRPWVQLKLGMSLDGRTALSNGRSQWISSHQARSDVQLWRAASAAIVTGSGTVLADDPLLTVRHLSSPAALPPVRVVLDSKARVPGNARVFNSLAPSLHVIGLDASLDPSTTTGNEVLRLQSDENGVDLAQLMHVLSERGLHDVFVEAGPTLAGALLKAGLVDELLVYIAPRLLGDIARPMVHLPELTSLHDSLNFSLYEVTSIGPDLRLRLRPDQNETVR